MKRNIKMLIIAIVILAVIIGAYFLVIKWEPKTESVEENPFDYKETQYLIDADSENIKHIEFSNGKDKYTIINGEKPSIKGYRSVIIDDGLLSSAIYSASKIAAGHVVKENADDLSAYGLEDADKYVSLVFDDMTEKVLLIGNPTNIDGEYYAMIKDELTVYTISSYTAEKLLISPDEYRSMELCLIDGPSTSAFTIEKGGKPVLSVAYDENYKAVSEHLPVSYLVTYPYHNVKASLDKIDEFVKTISSPVATEIIEENPKNLSKYGLDDGYTLNIRDANGNATIKMGDYADDGNVYVMCNDVPVVYTAQCSFYESVKSARANEFVDRFIGLFSILDTRHVNIRTKENEYELSINEKGKDKYEYRINDKIKAEENFKKIYQNVIGILAADFIDEKPSGKEYCVMKFDLKDGTKKTITYFEYDERRCIVRADNGMNCLVMKKDIDAMLDSIK